MPTAAMKRLFVESESSSSSSAYSGGGGGAGRWEAEPAAAVLCAPRPRRVYPCSADLILDPPAFLLAPDSSNNTTKKKKEGKSKSPEEEQEADGEDGDGSWAPFGGSPPARAGNPLVNDPHFLLNQRHHAAAAPDLSPALFDLAVFDDHVRSRYHSHRPTYNSSSINSSFAPSFAPAVRIQGFDVAACRSSHSSGAGGRVLSARA